MIKVQVIAGWTCSTKLQMLSVEPFCVFREVQHESLEHFNYYLLYVRENGSGNW